MTNQRSVCASGRSVAASERVLIAAHDDAPGRMLEAAAKGKVTASSSLFVLLLACTSLTCPRRSGLITTGDHGCYIIGSHTSRDPNQATHRHRNPVNVHHWPDGEQLHSQHLETEERACFLKMAIYRPARESRVTSCGYFVFIIIIFVYQGRRHLRAFRY